MLRQENYRVREHALRTEKYQQLALVFFMARIVILEHEFQIANPFMLAAFATRWIAAGHEVLWHRGVTRPPPGDLAILHINMTVVSAPYRALLKHYPKVINGSVVDISKRLFSANILPRDAPWDGAVIVKTNTNFGGLPEFNARAASLKPGLQSDIPVGPRLVHYPIFHSINDVPDAYWREPGLIVERFTPEIDDDGNYCVRVWTFFGDEQRCALWRSKEQQVKSGNAFERSAADPPRNLSHWRRRLGFEFGKFDYVIHNGREVLLDVNRTPTFPRGGSPNADAAADQLARGISSFLSIK
ncbi:MAG: hypothetical protein ACI915_001919 [Gammaproteobacteria bacterium]|jgi:hypothetical protein